MTTQMWRFPGQLECVVTPDLWLAFSLMLLLSSRSQQELNYDPIFDASTQNQNAVGQTTFYERGLALIAVPWPWATALKLMRHTKQDTTDWAAVLRLGVVQRTIRWTLAGLEQRSRSLASILTTKVQCCRAMLCL